GMLTLTTSPCQKILLRSEGRYATAVCSDGITEASFSYIPEKFGRFFRFELVDANGKHAFSRAFRTQDLTKFS
ncbi:MAG: hypothetical protein IJY42_06105, partial [Clostridia bacterium]|nr:hypothetical protein [Clostridia bacterium]